MSNPLAGWAAANRSEGYAPPFGGSGRVRVTFHDFTPHSDDRALRAPKPLAHRQHCRAYGNRTLCALHSPESPILVGVWPVLDHHRRGVASIHAANTGEPGTMTSSEYTASSPPFLVLALGGLFAW